MAAPRPAPLLDAFRFSAAYSCAEAATLQAVALAEELAGQPLPSTSRTHPERTDLQLHASGPYELQITSARPAKRPANWVRKLHALHASIDKALVARSALLLPGPAPFSPPVATAGSPACMRQGLRLELPFERPGDFGKLMAALRVALPLFPAISASTPFSQGKPTGHRSFRLRCWLGEYDLHPERVGGFIPEAHFELADHDREVIGPIAQAIARSGAAAPDDPQALDWRAATVQIDPDAIVTAAIDMQENPAADMAVLEFIIAILRALAQGRWVSSYLQRAWSTDDLMAILSGTIASGSDALITNRDYLLMFGLMKQEQLEARRLLQHLFVELYGELSENARAGITIILEHGELAGRLLAKAGKRPSADRIRAVMAELARCRTGAAFL